MAEAGGQVVCGAVGEVTALIPGPNVVNGSVGLISNVATVHAWRGRGLAAACTDHLLRWFVEQTDVRRVDLFATEAGAPIYTRRGFARARLRGDVPARAPLTGRPPRALTVESREHAASPSGTRRVLYSRLADVTCRLRRPA